MRLITLAFAGIVGILYLAVIAAAVLFGIMLIFAFIAGFVGV